MATYVPNASDTTQPTGDKKVASAPPEFRAIKVKLDDVADDVADFSVDLAGFQAQLDALQAAIGAGDSSVALAANLANAISAIYGPNLVAYNAALAYTFGVGKKLKEWVSIKDFGAIGTAVPGNVTADTAAYLAARAIASTVFIPDGTYYFSVTATAGANQSLIGQSEGGTTIIYTGTGNGIYMGGPGNVSLIYNSVVKNLTLVCTNRAATVNGIYLDNAVHFVLENVTAVGSGSPNSVTPADWVLYGAGVTITNNSIIGKINKVSCRIWAIGRYYKTLAGSQSYWSAAIEDSGQGELSNNMIGLRVGDPAVAFNSGAGLHFHSNSLQGNYSLGADLNAAENTTIDHCYFEGNAIHDITIGGAASSPLKVRILHNRMNTEGIGANNYGSAAANAYTDKVSVLTGSQAFIFGNDCSISTAIPVVRIAAPCNDTHVKENRLNSGNPVNGRIVNNSATTITADNIPEAPTVAIASFTRALNGTTASVAYTGLGFRPTSIEFWAAVDTATERCFGGCDASSGLQNRCMSTDAAGNNLSSADCIRIIRSTAGNEQKAVLASFDADGFTLAWTLIGAPPGNTLVVNYIARR